MKHHVRTNPFGPTVISGFTRNKRCKEKIWESSNQQQQEEQHNHYHEKEIDAYPVFVFGLGHS
jgi:hypothetical protein